MEEVFGKKIKMKADITHFVLGLKKSIERLKPKEKNQLFVSIGEGSTFKLF
jgi:hypothetical protein